jgi:hypothetical protein
MVWPNHGYVDKMMHRQERMNTNLSHMDLKTIEFYMKQKKTTFNKIKLTEEELLDMRETSLFGPGLDEKKF